MSIQKKSLISNRLVLIASQPESEQSNPLKANSLTAQSMKSKMTRLNFKACKGSAKRPIL